MQGTRPLGAIILVKFEFFSVLGAVNPHPWTDQGQIWQGGADLWRWTYGPLLPAKFDLDRCNVSPLRGEKPQNRWLDTEATTALAKWNCLWKTLLIKPIMIEIHQLTCAIFLSIILYKKNGHYSGITNNNVMLVLTSLWVFVSVSLEICVFILYM